MEFQTIVGFQQLKKIKNVLCLDQGADELCCLELEGKELA